LKIYKRGSSVRIDTTLVGFDTATSWKRGNESFIFRFSENSLPQLVVVDHDSQTATTNSVGANYSEDLSEYEPSQGSVDIRMSSPVDTTYVDIDKIGFIKTALLQVFNASNVEIVTKTRTEHLLEEDKERFRRQQHDNPLNAVLRLAEKRQECTSEMKQTGSDVYCGLTPEQYLDPDYSMENRDIGHPKQVLAALFNFLLCENIPFQLFCSFRSCGVFLAGH
uniref:Rho-GAP domain-containing protein n=1 Tax=Gongylonema pulchrum TaxID=637853 RepID=A0A183DZ66_9BILA